MAESAASSHGLRSNWHERTRTTDTFGNVFRADVPSFGTPSDRFNRFIGDEGSEAGS
jgi:hypothetical protein